jgi:5-methylcytosine-specific restriction protein A
VSKHIGQFQHLYSSAWWRRRRLIQLREYPLCAFCLARGVTTVATVCDHIEKHGGNALAFRTNALQSLCRDCHERRKKSIEKLGFDRTVGLDGWYCDPLHPSNRGKRFAG